jgi:hypothetical protein
MIIFGQSCRHRRERANRLAMATFRHTFHHDGKFSPAWYPPSPSHSIYRHEQSCCTLQLRGHADTLLLFLLYPFLFYGCENTDLLGNKFYCVRSGGDVRSHWYNFVVAFQCGNSLITVLLLL